MNAQALKFFFQMYQIPSYRRETLDLSTVVLTKGLGGAIGSVSSVLKHKTNEPVAGLAGSSLVFPRPVTRHLGSCKIPLRINQPYDVLGAILGHIQMFLYDLQIRTEHSN